ncbi:aminodeoxychorismate synthase component I [Haloflavibacter putidus]|uniref:aminodeoxychorismate synthase component I n=1 Tax=Haloflavibacter putidus TaxID=2576776 RepID=UPI001F1749B5|nr:aminodeoxychorismate synthase component I [Haloflavibacter putidus]
MRVQRTFPINDSGALKAQLLEWAQAFEEIVYLDSNSYSAQHPFEAILAVEAFTALKTDYKNAFEQLDEYQKTTKDWIFGYLSYDLKNDTEKITSTNHDGLAFPDLYFFQPQRLIFLKKDEICFDYLNLVGEEIEEDFLAIKNCSVASYASAEAKEYTVTSKICKEKYLEKVEQFLTHLKRGDIYEANFCQEFYVENVQIDPKKTFQNLNLLSKAPFAAFLKLEEFFLLSGSPERYLKKEGEKIISQPIKGTAARSKNPAKDQALKEALPNDPKERAENIMIVDLVRNDLSKTAAKGSVKVEELCEVYSFKTVHQLISTISSSVKENIAPVEIIKSTFPMGSMTGAPKLSAMQIIEELEESKRGLYSGAVGYFTPNGDFDFNVVIRSVLYNKEKKYCSFSVGGAITAKSIPEKEYEECTLKAAAMHKALKM